MKRKLSLALILVMLLTAAVPVESLAAVKVTKVTMNLTAVTLTKGKSFTLKAKISPSGASKKKVKWTTSNKKVATVTSKGLVKGIKAGTATITAKATDGSGKKATCKVTVKASVPNVTDSILKMTGARAGKKLNIKYIATTAHISHLEKNLRGSYIRNTAYRKGGWNLHIRDKKITFYGCKLGMTKKQIAAKLKKVKWKKTENENWEDGTSYILYKPTNTKSHAYKTKGSLEVWFDENGKVYRMDYCVG